MATKNSISQVSELMARLDGLAFEEPKFFEGDVWRPESKAGRETLALLVADERRDSLRQWYARLRGVPLNPVAERIRRTLETIIGEKLK
ncbi:MAG: hypothetical protein KY475_21865 [Planctomycetes bacterium]|nr:hypothetical protein [Planctomycetota bacterium]